MDHRTGFAPIACWLLPMSIAVACSPAAPEPRDGPAPVEFPDLPAHVSGAEKFVPEGWNLVAIKSGDLNGDNKPDVAMLMRMADSANVAPVTSSPYYTSDDTNPYLLAIGFADMGGYTLAASNHALFPREVAPMHSEDPPGEDTVEIARGDISITLGHLRGFDRLRFRWNGNALALIGYDCAGVSGGLYTSLSANYVTRQARYERGPIDSDESVVSTVEIRPDARPTLDQINWGFDWSGTDITGTTLGC